MSTSTRIDDIEVLRAVAVLMVVVHHLRALVPVGLCAPLDTMFGWFNGGHGVDLFFAISGFVIARDLLPRLRAARGERGQRLRCLAAFWLRRAFRLLPSAWLCLGFIVAVALLLDSTGSFGSAGANAAGALAALLQLANVYFPFHFGSATGLGATYHFWSLSLEEQFYLLLPLLMLSGRAFPAIAAALVLAQLFSVRPNFFYWMFRTDALLLGVLIACWSERASHARLEPAFLRRRPMHGAIALPLLVAAIALVNAPRAPDFDYPLSVVALCSAALVLLASWDRGCFTPAGRLRTVLLWTGSRSYAIYLWHVPLLRLARDIADRFGYSSATMFHPGVAMALVVTTLLLLGIVSESNFRLLEAPLRRRGQAIAQRWTRGR